MSHIMTHGQSFALSLFQLDQALVGALWVTFSLTLVLLGHNVSIMSVWHEKWLEKCQASGQIITNFCNGEKSCSKQYFHTLW